MSEERQSLATVIAQWLADLKPQAQGGVFIGALLATLFAGGKINDLMRPEPVTGSKLDSVTNVLRDEVGQAMGGIAELTTRKIMRVHVDSLRAVADRMTDSVAVPMLNRQADLMERMRRVERQLGIATARIEQMPAPDNAGIQRLVQQAEGANDNAEKLDRLLEAVRSIDERLQDVEHRVPRTIKGKF